MMLLLIGIYAVITVTAAFERNWPRALYFIGAIVISVAVLWMTNGKAAHT
jgi:drug/metabolite transporter (DMT)-like permease